MEMCNGLLFLIAFTIEVCKAFGLNDMISSQITAHLFQIELDKLFYDYLIHVYRQSTYTYKTMV